MLNMKREWGYAAIGLAFWILFYFMFLISTADAAPAISDFVKETLIIQLFILILPGLIISLIYYKIGSINNNEERRTSLVISTSIIVAFLVIFRFLYL